MLFDVVKDKVHECIFYAYIEYTDQVINSETLNPSVYRSLKIGNTGSIILDDNNLFEFMKDLLKIHITNKFPDELLDLSTFYRGLSKVEKELYDKHMEYLRSHDDYVMDYPLYIKDLLTFIKKHFEYKFYIHLYHVSKRDSESKIGLQNVYDKYVRIMKGLIVEQKALKVNSVIDKVHEKYYVRYGNINLGFDKSEDMFDFIKIINEVRMVGL